MPLQKQPKRGRQDVETIDENNPIDEPEIRVLLMSLSTKIDTLSSTMSGVDQRLNVKMDGMELSLSKKIGDVKDDMDKRLLAFSTEVDKRFQEVVVSSDRKCEEAATQVSTDVLNRLDELRAIHDFRLDKL